jgi:hypothetical protein
VFTLGKGVQFLAKDLHALEATGRAFFLTSTPRAGREQINRQQFYISLSRARHDALIFADSREAVPRAIARTAGKAVALEAVGGMKFGPERWLLGHRALK